MVQKALWRDLENILACHGYTRLRQEIKKNTDWQSEIFVDFNNAKQLPTLLLQTFNMKDDHTIQKANLFLHHPQKADSYSPN